MLKFEPTGSVIGARVSGIRLDTPPNPQEIAQIEDPLETHGVLIFAV